MTHPLHAVVDDMVERYLDHVRRHAPVEATRLGLSGHDGDLDDLSPAALDARARSLASLERQAVEVLDSLPEPVTGAVREARDDLRLLRAEVAFRRFALHDRPRFVLDPLAVLDLIASGFHEPLRRAGVDPDAQCQALEAAAQRARRVPVLVEQAGQLLASAPAPHLAIALRRVEGLVALVRDELPRRADRLGIDVSPAVDAGEVAAEALEAYGALLVELGEEPAGDWRLGPAHHRRVLRDALGTELVGGAIHERARVLRDEVRAEMAEMAASSWSRRFPGEPVPVDETERIRRTLRAIADTAVPADGLVDEARRALDEARAFARHAGLTDVPPADQLRVAEVPDELLGIAVAFVTPPPPLQPAAGCTLYLSSVPAGWDATAVRAFLREYNPAQLRSLAIHEGYPGHFVQLQHAARHPRLARRLFAKPVFAEGWAVYIEREVLQAGFATSADCGVDADDYRMTQRKLELRIATNAMLDVGLHSGDLDDPGALEMLTAGAFQTPDEAAGKLQRAKVASGQLSSYFIGGEELADLRRHVEAVEGDAFDARLFHQRVLSHGTPMVSMVADAIADDAPVRRPFALSASATS